MGSVSLLSGIGHSTISLRSLTFLVWVVNNVFLDDNMGVCSVTGACLQLLSGVHWTLKHKY